MNLFAGNSFLRKADLLWKILLRSVDRPELLRAFRSAGNNGECGIEAVFIINLDRQPSRWKFIARESRRLKVEGGKSVLDFCQRVSAVDAKAGIPTDSTSEVSAIYPLEAQYYVDPDPRLLPRIREGAVDIRMTREEIAIALSHLKVWRRIVTEKIPYALILEDDIFFERPFATQLNKTWQELSERRHEGSDFDVLYLSYCEVERGAQRISLSPNLTRVIRGYWWMSGYVVSYRGANRLLNSLPIKGPVDLWLNQRFPELEIYSTPVSIISQRKDLPSSNSYSILPLLSQLGVQSDGTHLVLEQTKGRHPVFALGFDRQGAAWLEVALSVLGYRCVNDSSGFFSENFQRLFAANAPLLFDAYVGVEFLANIFQELGSQYPAAVFILPSSSTEGCNLSQNEHAAILARFSGRPDKCFNLRSQPESDWSRLCTFLNCATSRIPMPTMPQLSDASGAAAPPEVMAMNHRSHTVLQHDVHPWVVPYERLAAFGVLSSKRTSGKRTGSLRDVRNDTLGTLDQSYWAALEDTFPSNLAGFSPDNISCSASHGCQLTLTKQLRGKREYSAASFASRESYQFGRFEAVMKPAKAAGVVTAFFLHRISPWQEIDLEFLGRDTTRILGNVYFNPGEAGTDSNYGNRGTPIMIDLGFDAAEDFHRYAIEWEPNEIRWFVDNQLVHVRAVWEPTPVPNLPMQLHCSIWPPRSTELAGEIHDVELPVSSQVKSIIVSAWTENLENLDCIISDST
jgi:GR25 family glycosyltransferase involved in LPS biosynthesis